jgi:hypothetical protein
MPTEFDTEGWPLWAWLQHKGTVVQISQMKAGKKYVFIPGEGKMPEIVTPNEDLSDAFKNGGEAILMAESGNSFIVGARTKDVFYEAPPMKAGRRRRLKKTRKPSRKSRKSTRRNRQ